MRKELGLNYAHLLANEKSDPFVNVHFWLVPVEGTTSPDLLDFDKLIVNSQKKEIDCLENNVEVFIDDSFKNCINVYNKLHIPVFLFDSRYNKYNSYPEIERVYSWDEIYTKIKNKF